MNPKHALKIRWAGPAVVLALVLTPAVPREAVAEAERVSAAAAEVPCAREALAYAEAFYQWWQAWSDYNNAVPGGTGEEIMNAAIRLDQATARVVETGTRLVLCLSGLGGGRYLY